MNKFNMKNVYLIINKIYFAKFYFAWGKKRTAGHVYNEAVGWS